MIFTEEERDGLRALTERRGKKGKRMKDVRAHQVKAPSSAVIWRQFKDSISVLNSLSSALQVAGHPKQAREIDYIRGEVQGVQKRIKEL